MKCGWKVKIREEEDEGSSLLRPNFIIRYLGNKTAIKSLLASSLSSSLQEDLNFGRLSYKLLL